VKGKLGELTRHFKLNEVKLQQTHDKIVVSMKNPRRKEKAYVGTIAAHVRNMIVGVTQGYEYRLKIIYAHFPINVSVEVNRLVIKNFAGEKTPRYAKIIEGVKVDAKGQEISVSGIDIEKVGQTSANIEQATRIKKRDLRVFQDGIYLIAGKQRV
jgi:large subunit ribosomal protein L6